MSIDVCSFCGGHQFETCRTEYLYSYQGEYLLIPDMPVEVCADCGMIYYEAAALKRVENRFFAIREHTEEPDEYLKIPAAAYALYYCATREAASSRFFCLL